MPAPKGNDYAKGNDGGRPTKYKKDYAIQAERLSKHGLTDMEMAEFWGINVSTLYRWKAEHEEFCNSLKVGKDICDERVERSLYERALGYSHPEDKILQNAGEAVIVPTIKHYPPDTTAGIFWLKNRRPNEWREKQEVGVTDKEGNDVMPPLDLAKAMAFALEKGARSKKDGD